MQLLQRDFPKLQRDFLFLLAACCRGGVQDLLIVVSFASWKGAEFCGEVFQFFFVHSVFVTPPL